MAWGEWRGNRTAGGPQGFWNMTTIAMTITAHVTHAEIATRDPTLCASSGSQLPETTLCRTPLGGPDHELGQGGTRDPEHQTQLHEGI